MNEIYLMLLASFCTMLAIHFVNYITKASQKHEYKKWYDEDLYEAEKNFRKTMYRFDNMIESEHYSKEIVLLMTRMKGILENNFKQINKECHSYEYNVGRLHSINFYFEHVANCLQGNIEEIFLEYTINLTPREKEILDDLIRVRSIYLTHEEKKWLHEKCKEIYETK